MAIIVLSTVILTNISCAPAKEGGFLRVLDSAAQVKIEGERNGVEFGATLSLGAKDESGMRDGEMTFTSPSALCGIKIVSAGGVYGAELDGISFSGIPAELLAAPLELMSGTGEVSAAEKFEAEDGSPRTLIVMNKECGSVEFVIDSKSGLPVSVKEKDKSGNTVTEFEITEYKIIQ